jgi:hypothetical protein
MNDNHRSFFMRASFFKEPKVDAARTIVQDYDKLDDGAMREAASFLTPFCHECPLGNGKSGTCVELAERQAKNERVTKNEAIKLVMESEPAKCTRAVQPFRDEDDWLQTLPPQPVVKPGKMPRILAIYFPQYHPDPLNDKNWGINFTDWNSLQAAPSRNRLGLRIPRPSELGYYDLRNRVVRKRQGDLARAYGIDGFIMHHYWFYDESHPGPNLHAPLERMLADGEPNVPFCFNWCAVQWTNVWMGRSLFDQKPTITKNNPHIIQDQYWNATDDQITAHYVWLKQFFHHPNYIKIHGEPVFVFYHWDETGFATPILERLRALAIEDGFPGLYWVVGRSDHHPDLLQVSNDELDEPTARNKRRTTQSIDQVPVGSLFNKSMTYPNPLRWIQKPYSIPTWCSKTDNDKMNQPHNSTREEIPGIAVTFDNTPRREFKHSTLWNVGEPDEVVNRFRKSLDAALYYDSCCHDDTAEQNMEERFVAINAWNEWAEGMSLEPSDVYGRRFLEAIREGKQQQLKERNC